MKFTFTVHALEEMQRRGIAREQVKPVLANPGQKFTEYGDVISTNRRSISTPKHISCV